MDGNLNALEPLTHTHRVFSIPKREQTVHGRAIQNSRLGRYSIPSAWPGNILLGRRMHVALGMLTVERTNQQNVRLHPKARVSLQWEWCDTRQAQWNDRSQTQYRPA